MSILAEAGADVLACETVPAAAEAEALIAEADALGVPIWLSLTTVVGEDGIVRTRRGEPAAEVFALAAGVRSVIAVGANCIYPAGALSAVEAAAAAGLPVVVYPNSGERWEGNARRWTGEVGFRPDDVAAWVPAGARLVGGCCRVRPEHIRALARAVRSRRLSRSAQVGHQPDAEGEIPRAEHQRDGAADDPGLGLPGVGRPPGGCQPTALAALDDRDDRARNRADQVQQRDPEGADRDDAQGQRGNPR
jgi:homocysteine S-methyltransferase